MNQTEVAEVVSDAFAQAGEFGDDYEAYFDAIGLPGKIMSKVAAGSATQKRSGGPRTIWLDLSVGAEEIWGNFHSQMRKGVRRAERGGVVCGVTRDPAMLGQFISMCEETSRTKNFTSGLTRDLADRLCLRSSGSGL